MIYGTHPRARKSDTDEWPSGTACGTFEDLAIAVRATCERLAPMKADFDAIVVTGVSGLAVGAPAALRLHKPLLVVRKHGEYSHGNGGEVIGLTALARKIAEPRILFLDDFVSCGTTRKNVEAALRGYNARFAIAATYEYHHDRLSVPVMAAWAYQR